MRYELVTTSEYLSDHEVLLIKADMSNYLLEYYHHRQKIAPTTPFDQDAKLKDLIAAFAIHLSARSAVETHGWTLHIVNSAPYALYVTGTTGKVDEKGIARGYIVGNTLTDHIRYSDTHGLHAQVSSRGKIVQSYVPSENSDIPSIVQTFFEKSEQRPIRIKISENSDTALGLVGLSNVDTTWLESVNLEELVLQTGSLNRIPMRNCSFEFRCECSAQKLLPYFVALSDEAINDLYGKDDEIVITCPRCGKLFLIDREMIAMERAK